MNKRTIRVMVTRILLALMALSAALPMLPAQAAPADPFTGASPTFSASPKEATNYNVGEWGVADQSGTATYTFEIPVPPGRNGMAPALALRYSSGSPLSGGIAAGWTLNLPTIEMDYALGVDAGKRYKAAIGDTSGRLEPVTDENPFDDSNAAFRVNFDSSFTRFFRRRPGATAWTALTIDGMKHHFSSLGMSGPEPRWVIDRQEDSFGNTIAYFWSTVSEPFIEDPDIGANIIDASLGRIEYSSNAAAGLDAHAKVEFEYAPMDLCEDSNVPIGAAQRTASSQVDGTRRLVAIRTLVRDAPASDWRLSRQITLTYALRASQLYQEQPVIASTADSTNTDAIVFTCEQKPLRYLTQIDVAAFDGAGTMTTSQPITFAYNYRINTMLAPEIPTAHPMRIIEIDSPGYAQHGDSGRIRGGIQGDSMDLDGDGIRDRVSVVREDDLCKLVWRKGMLGGAFATEEHKSLLPTVPWYADWKGRLASEFVTASEGCTLNGQIAYRDYESTSGSSLLWGKGIVSYHFLDYTGDGRLDLLTNVWATVCHWTYNPVPDLETAGDPCSFALPDSELAAAGPAVGIEEPPGGPSFIPMSPEGEYVWRVYAGTGDSDALFEVRPLWAPMLVRSPMPLSPSASDERLDTSVLVEIGIPPLVDIDGDGFVDIVDTGKNLLNDCESAILGHCDWTVYFGDGDGEFPEIWDAYIWHVPSFTPGVGQGFEVDPDPCGLEEERIDTIYADLHDINGDGLPDLLAQTSDFELRAYLNFGERFSTEPVKLNSARPVERTQTDCVEIGGNDELLEGARAYLRRLVDLDGDGLLDVLVVNDSNPVLNIAADHNLNARFNLGDRFGPPTTLSGSWDPVKRLLEANLEPVENDPILGDDPFAGVWHVASDFTDVNGDGLADLVKWDGETLSYISHPGLPNAPDLLSAVENGRGMRVEFAYAPSTDTTVVQWTDAAPALLPYVTWVVKQTTVSGGFDTPDMVTQYLYQDPVYLSPQNHTAIPERSRFAGFSQVNATTTMADGALREVQQRYAYEGIDADASVIAAPNGFMVQELIYDQGELHRYQENQWIHLPLFAGQVQVTLSAGSQSCIANGPGISLEACMGQPSNVHRRQESWTAIAPSTWDNPPEVCGDPCIPSTDAPELYLRTESVDGMGVGPAAGDRRVLYTHNVRYGQQPLLVCDPLLPCEGMPKDAYHIRVSKNIREVADSGLNYTQVGQSTTEYSRDKGLPIKTSEWFDADTVAETTHSFDTTTGNLLSVTKPSQQSTAGGSGNSTTFTYDTHALFVTMTTNEAGHQLHTLFDVATGVQLERAGPNFVTREGQKFWEREVWKIDGFGRVVEHAVSFDDGSDYALHTIDKLTYFDSEQPNRIREEHLRELGSDVWVTSERALDGLGRVLTEIQFLENDDVALTTYAYDAAGNATAIEMPDPRSDDGARVRYTYTYDTLGRLRQFMQPDGNGLTISYTGLEETLQELTADGSGSMKKEVYDVFGQLVELHEFDPLSSTTVATAISRYQYDGQGNLMLVTDAEGSQTSFEHDWMSNRIAISRGGRTWRYSYDLNGNVSTRLAPMPADADPELYATTYTYNDLDRITMMTFMDQELTASAPFTVEAASVLDSINYVYDQDRNGIGRLSRVELPFGTIRYGYEARGLVASEERMFTLSDVATVSATQRVQRQYNALGQLTHSVWDDGQQWQLTYDGRGLVDTVEWFDPQANAWEAVADFDRSLFGLPRTRNSAYGQVRHYAYDDMGRTVEEIVTVNDSTVATRGYTFNDAGNLTQVSGFTSGLSAEASYTYDAQQRLQSASGPNGYVGAFTYSASGNVATAAVSWNGSTESRQVRYEYGNRDPQAVDQLIDQVSGTPYAEFDYDLSGNMSGRTTPEGATTMLWDGREQMRLVNGPNGIEIYFYDHDGMRMLSVSQSEGVRFWFGESETHYALDGVQSIRYLHLSAGGSALARIENKTKIELQYADGLQNLMLVLDEAGNAIASFLYGAFGEVVQATGDADHRRQFNGKENDGVSGLYYYGYRYYDALTMRWASADPLYQFLPDLGLQTPQRMNLYGFSLNNPLRYFDPDGRDGKESTRKVDVPPDTRCWWSRNYGQCELQRGLEDYDARIARNCFCSGGSGKLSISVELVNKPEFRAAFLRFLSTKEGKRLVESLTRTGLTYHLRNNDGSAEDLLTGKKLKSEDAGRMFFPRLARNLGPNETAALLNVQGILNRYGGRLGILRLANTIYHELRHAEIEFQYSADEALIYHCRLDCVYTVPSFDVPLAAFQREIGLTP